ncbi:copper amine oxidase [Mycena alexandri]|uniref:Amine oxidase n=1 Tax=Mycena alexandri TaxID=1745969 RepID=A0AAD6SSW1_9AGAR|nr:copper amine oxidase [Mycena alexandri]
MILPAVLLVLSSLLHSAIAGPHARLKSPKKWSKKPGLVEILSATANSTFSAVVSAPKPNIFLSLSNDEAAAVISFLHNQTELNLTANAVAGPWDNAIEVVDLVQPNKTDALAYLDNGGPIPARYAMARIAFGATEKPYLQEFMVGPLPISKTSTYESLDWPTTSGSSKIRNYNADDDLLTQWNLDVTASVADIVLDLLNGTATGSDDDDFDIWGIDPLWMEEIDGAQRVIVWNTYWRFPSEEDAVFDGETLLPQGLFFKSDITGRDSSKWRLLGWLYGDIFYSTTEEFRKAWKSPGFVKYELNLPGEWIGTDQTGDFFPADNIAPPVAVQPNGLSGQRFAVDEAQKYVEWMDFSFYITFTRDTGLRLFDIKYRGERIIYELGLQEAIANYAGNDPVQSGTSYMDSFYGFGPYAFELVPGYDCPTYSHFLNSTFHAAELSTTHRNNICLFESDPGYLMQRHSSSNYLALTKNIVFTLRSVSTVGNYDYNFDYVFALDGSIETVVRASGYIQSAYYAKNNNYGYRVHDALSGSMHDHVLNWKVDIDVLGTANSFVEHKIVPVDVKYPWANQTRSTMQLQRVRIENEANARLSWPQNGGAMFLVENSDKPNKYGEPRGYKIAPSRGGAGMYLTIQDSPNLLKSVGFAKHALSITKQKDTEVRAAHANNDYDPGHPIIDFDQFFNDENLNQTDIVVWINLGMHHVPHTGDMPNTVFTTAQSAFIISPHNYLLNDASRTSRQMVRIDYNSTGVQLVKEFGGKMASGVVNITALQPNFHTYEGDVATRKFPYDRESFLVEIVAYSCR